MRILGIDPGLATLGFGVVEEKRNVVRAIHYGAILTAQYLSIGRRLEMIQKELIGLIKTYAPDVACVETLFFFQNQKTIIQIGQVHGILALTFHKKKIPVVHYPPLQVKSVVTGDGRAKKKEVQERTRAILGLPKERYPDDTYDALAIALCHIFKQNQGPKAQIKKRLTKIPL